jgi:hypothetical protein
VRIKLSDKVCLIMNKKNPTLFSTLALASLIGLSGCTDDGLSLNNTQTGALTGGALGAGLGAIIGNQSGHPGAGVAIGAGAGALGGALIGGQGDRQKKRTDDQEERLRRQERELERQRRELEELRGRRSSDNGSGSTRDSRTDRQYDDRGDDFNRGY